MVINRQGAVVLRPRYKWVNSFDEAGLSLVPHSCGCYGFMNEKGQLVIPARFKHATSFSCGRARVEIDGRWGFIDLEGRVVIEPTHADATSFVMPGLAAVANEQGLWGCIDPQGRLVIDQLYADIDPSLDGEALFVKRLDGRRGYLGYDGRWLCDYAWDEGRKKGAANL